MIEYPLWTSLPENEKQRIIIERASEVFMKSFPERDTASLKVMERPIYQAVESEVDLIYIPKVINITFDERKFRYIGEWDLKTWQPHGFGVICSDTLYAEGYMTNVD